MTINLFNFNDWFLNEKKLKNNRISVRRVGVNNAAPQDWNRINFIFLHEKRKEKNQKVYKSANVYRK